MRPDFAALNSTIAFSRTHSGEIDIMGLRKIILLAGLAFPVLAGAGVMNLFSGFTVEGQVILEPQQYSRPVKLAKAADGGYFVIGESNPGGASWLDKTDAQGNLLWSYRYPVTVDAYGNFATAEPAADGGVLICGSRQSRIVNRTAGLAVRLDKNGHEIARLQDSFNDNSYGPLAEYESCARWGEDFVVIGKGLVLDPSPSSFYHVKGVFTVQRLHSDGTLIWRKDVEAIHGAFSTDMLQAMPNGDLVFIGIEAVVRIDPQGNLLAQESIDAGCRLLRQPVPTDQLKLICYTYVEKRVPEIVELGPKLRVIKKTPFPISDNVGVAQAYALADDSLVVFGSTRSWRSNFIPAVFLFSSTGSLIAKHEYEKKEDEGGVTDGMPTGTAGEFVIIRATNEPDARTTMTFLKRN
jgi:hypothetical protein